MTNRVKAILLILAGSSVLAIVWLLLNQNATSDDSCRSVSESDIDSILGFAKDYDATQLFVIHGFGGYVAIPNDFALLMADYGNGDYQFVPSGVLGSVFGKDVSHQQHDLCRDEIRTSGNIVFGRIESCDICGTTYFEENRIPIIEKIITDTVSVLLVKPMPLDTDPLSLLFFDKDSYLMISDTNLTFLKAIRTTYIHTRDAINVALEQEREKSILK
jgi:hypothetical protein